jgi:hypothetical protein
MTKCAIVSHLVGEMSLGRFLQCCFSVEIMFGNAITVVCKRKAIPLPNHNTRNFVGGVGVQLHILLTSAQYLVNINANKALGATMPT